MAEKAKIGRPTIYSDAYADLICDQLELGKSIVEICADVGMPDKSTIFRWLADDDKKYFCDRYSKSHKIHLLVEADELKFIADTVNATSAEVQKAALQIKTRIWRLSKLEPLKYGDKPEAVTIINNPVPNTSNLTIEELAQWLALKRKMNGNNN